MHPADPVAAVDPLVPQPVRIEDIREDTHDTFSLSLDLSSLAQPFSFRPGQFCMLYVFGQGEIPVSISAGSEDAGCIVFTIRAVGHVTRRMRQLQPGAMLGLRGPFGTGWPVEAARGKDILIVAGGIGLAPLRQFMLDLLRQRGDYGCINLFYGTRSPADILYSAELSCWSQSERTCVGITVDHGDCNWNGGVGVVTTLLERGRFEPANSLAVICGPEIMMRFCHRKLGDLGLSDDSIFLSMERNMQCATGFCGHCQYGADFICRDGPVFPASRIRHRLGVREL